VAGVVDNDTRVNTHKYGRLQVSQTDLRSEKTKETQVNDRQERNF